MACQVLQRFIGTFITFFLKQVLHILKYLNKTNQIIHKILILWFKTLSLGQTQDEMHNKGDEVT
jgi:hypothetical protein